MGWHLDLVDCLRKKLPGVCLSTDVIVGFPGETEQDYKATLELMDRVRFDSAFMFKYSPREGTVAYREIADTVSEDEKGLRLEAVIEQQIRISADINRTYLGKTLEVLVEGDSRKGGGQAVGKSDGFKTVVFPRESAETNQFVKVRITGSTSHTLLGHVEQLPEQTTVGKTR